MTTALSSMEYPHWLMIAGSLLLMLGLAGIALVHEALRRNPMSSRVNGGSRPSRKPS